MADIVGRLRFDAARCEIQFSNGIAGNITEAADEIERLRAPWRAVDSLDWEFLMGAIGDGGRGRFWKAVLSEMRGALEQKAEKECPWCKIVHAGPCGRLISGGQSD